MENIVGVKKLRENFAEYAEQVKNGRSFLVMKKSTPLFRIIPADENEDVWEEIIDFTKIKKGGVEIEEILSRL
ncbi:MAG: hypothetical protein Athens101428_681 [Candidatus Berkelbacteria bacterium Athens1014_28]|uniref:Antitoxin n=1 Tax=Candidatus Berkelbacteria bacterium Athens1014_28 TaxID=2017145 RepID=A0A554LKU4_9BACT|nr:MAG: hypothetical protein Athens101428_681 [Candidatus Berkelbacteria bacterium Athens1014_28]